VDAALAHAQPRPALLGAVERWAPDADLVILRSRAAVDEWLARSGGESS
jgi:hypothetical protein